MKNLLKGLTICAAIGATVNLNAASVTFNPASYSDAGTYMSWSQSAYTHANFPTDGGSASGGWSISALPAVTNSTTLTLSPNVNTYANDPGNTYWINPDGSGANTMDGAIYTEVDGGGLANQSVTFTFNVLSNTLAAGAPYGGYTADAFIKDFGPGFAFNGEQTVNLTGGVESVTFPLTGNNPGEIVQYGFELIGPDANPSTVSTLGNVVVAPVPEPSTIALVVAGLLGALTIRRRKA